MRNLELRLLSIRFEEMSGIFSSSDWVLSYELNAPKTRNILREQEIPPEGLSLNNLPNVLPFIDVPEISVTASGEEIRQTGRSIADVFVVTGGRDDVIKFLTQFGEPILSQWGRRDYIRYLPVKSNYVFKPLSSQGGNILRALYARKFLAQLHAVCLGEVMQQMSFRIFLDEATEGVKMFSEVL